MLTRKEGLEALTAFHFKYNAIKKVRLKWPAFVNNHIQCINVPLPENDGFKILLQHTTNALLCIEGVD